jgi:hypothetical protein
VETDNTNALTALGRAVFAFACDDLFVCFYSRLCLDWNFNRWEISHMTTLVRADEKGRLCIRGTQKGREYLVKAEKDGWWIVPVRVARPPKQRQWHGSNMSLAEHLSGLADSGLRLEQADAAKEKVGPCRF